MPFAHKILFSPDDPPAPGGTGDPPANDPPPAQPPGLSQEQVNAIVKERLARQASQFNSQLEGLGISGGLDGLKQSYEEQQRMAAEEAKKKGQYKGLYETEQRRAEELQQRIAQMETAQRNASVQQSIQALATDTTAPAQVAQLVQADLANRGHQILMRDGQAVVCNSEGMPATDGQGNFLTAQLVVSNFLNHNPWFRKAAPAGQGANSAPAGTPPPATTTSKDNPFGDLTNTDDIAKHKHLIKAAIRSGQIQ